MFTIFLNEYLYFENVHLYTYDIFCERIGFKLVWGCLLFYPFFYCVGVYSIFFYQTSNDISIIQLTFILIIYISGWALTRGANL
jgi:Delta14-sterol reductase